MKILYVTTISNTINFVTPHIELLLDEGHEVDIACNIKRSIDQKLINRNVHIYNINFQRSPLHYDNFNKVKKLRILIKKGGYDLVHTHTPVASFITRIACRKLKNVKVLYTAHGFHFFKGAPLKNWLTFYPIEKLASRWTSGVITINEEDYSLVNKKFSKKVNSHYTNGVGIDLEKFNFSKDRNEFREEYGYTKDDFILFYPAELNKNKHQDLLIKTVDILRNRIPNIKLLLAGPGPMEDEYKKMVEDLNLMNNVIFLGFRDDVPKLFSISNIAVASSKREGLPVNILEAMATGLPIVATNTRGHRDLIQDNENGFLINEDSPEKFAESIYKIYKSPELQNKFIKENLRKVKMYSNDVVNNQIKNIYRKYTNYKDTI